MYTFFEEHLYHPLIIFAAMTVARKTLNPFIYPLVISICLIAAIALLYINFSDFVMPYPVVIGLLIICALASLGSYIGYCKIPPNNKSLSARMWRIVLLVALGIAVIVLIAIPVLVIENA